VLAASIIALPVAIATFKKNWSVSDKNCITSVRFSLSMWSNEDITGAISRKNAYEEAILRWWNSSPIAIAFAISTFTFMPSSSERIASPNTGPSTSFIQCRRLITCSLYAPKRNTAPIPSFIWQYASLPVSLFSTTSTGILAEVIPPIGPTVFTWWHGIKVICPSSNNLRAPCSLSAHPSKRMAPTQEPCIGSVIFSYLIGGPACNNTFSSSSGILDLAGTTSTKNGAAAIILSMTAWLASSIVLYAILYRLSFIIV